jgi:hypothetical protein
MNRSNTYSLQISNSNSNCGKINPWDDSKNFIQDVGDLEGFLNFMNLSQIVKYDDEGSKNNLDLEEVENEVGANNNNQDLLILNYNLDLLKELNDISRMNYEKLKSLEVLYENYRSQSILSKIKNDELCDKISGLIEIFDKIENSRIKLANLIHNTHLTDNNIIKIKHDKKFEFIKIMKSIMTQMNNQKINQRNDIELIKLSSNVHPETLNKIVRLFMIT